MNIVTRITTQPRWRTQSIKMRLGIRLPPYLRIVIWLWVVMIGLVVVDVAMVRPNTQLANPFSAYAEIFPGQSAHAVIKQGFVCDTPAENCTRYPDTGVFNMVSVSLKERKVVWVAFTVRENKLTVGDLALIWGRPDIRLYGQSANFDWKNVGVSANGNESNGLFSYYISVTHIAISSRDPWFVKQVTGNN